MAFLDTSTLGHRHMPQSWTFREVPESEQQASLAPARSSWKTGKRGRKRIQRAKYRVWPSEKFRKGVRKWGIYTNIAVSMGKLMIHRPRVFCFGVLRQKPQFADTNVWTTVNDGPPGLLELIQSKLLLINLGTQVSPTRRTAHLETQNWPYPTGTISWGPYVLKISQDHAVGFFSWGSTHPSCSWWLRLTLWTVISWSPSNFSCICLTL